MSKIVEVRNYLVSTEYDWYKVTYASGYKRSFYKCMNTANSKVKDFLNRATHKKYFSQFDVVIYTL